MARQRYAASIPPGLDAELTARAEFVSAATATALLVLHLHHRPRAFRTTRAAAESYIAGAAGIFEVYAPAGPRGDRHEQNDALAEWQQMRDDALLFARDTWRRSSLWRACEEYVAPTVANLLGRFHMTRRPDPLTGEYELDPSPVDHYVGLVENVIGARVFDVVGPRAVALARAELRDDEGLVGYGQLGRLALDGLHVDRGSRAYYFQSRHASALRCAFELGYELDAGGELDDAGRVLRLAHNMRDGIPLAPTDDWPEDAHAATVVGCDRIAHNDPDGARRLFTDAAELLDRAPTTRTA